MNYFLQALVPLVVLVALWQFLRPRLASTALDNVPGPPGASWITGSINQLFNPQAWEFHERIAKIYGGIIRIKGAFGSNDLYVFEPDVIHHVLVKDQEIFEEPDWFTEGNRMLFGECLLTTHGNEHRRHRKMLNPLFSTAHLRQLVPVFHDVARKVQQSFLNKAQEGPTEIDIPDWMTRLSLELIGQAGLGYTFDDLTETMGEHPFQRASKQLIGAYSQDAFLRATVMPKIMRLGTARFRKFIVDHIPLKIVQDMRQIIQIMHDTSVEIFHSKKSLKLEEESKGNDIITTLMKANTLASDDDKLTDEEVLSQISSLTFAATDTTSSALSRTMHLLAHHKDIQSKLRGEIRNARKECGGHDFNYESIISLPYLDAIFKETLRLYPPVSTTQRTVRQDTILPLNTPIKGINGEKICEIPLKKGTNVIVSIIASNRNPVLWGPDAHEWKPERWLHPLPESLINARIPGVYSHLWKIVSVRDTCFALPTADSEADDCTELYLHSGFKFSQLEMKIVLALLLEDLEFSPGSKEIFWQMNSITQPNTDLSGIVPTMPLVISVAK